MSNIRRQSIISSLVIYIGFGVGLLNIYLFTRKGIFLDPQFGLYNAFIAIATLMMAFASFGMPTYIYKFFPYYKSHLPDKKNDQAAIALVTGIIGFIVIIIAGIVFKPLVVKKYITYAPEIITYYNWIFVLGFGLLIYTLLEAWAWQIHKSVLTNFLKELGWRLFTTVLIVLFAFQLISFDLFIKLFSFSYPAIALLLLAYLLYTKQIHFHFRLSKVTRRFSGNIVKLSSFVYAALVVFNISLVFDSLLISSVLHDALAQLAIYSVAQNIASMIQAPQRGIISASMIHLATAWKEKNMELIRKIYQRSSINQLLFAIGFFSLIVMNLQDAVVTFQLKDAYLDAFYVVIFLGLAKVVDMGTGVNSQIITTSTYWRFELFSGIVLLMVMLPLSYFLTKEYGIVGTGVAQLISISIYNLIRVIFLWNKFRLQPFSRQSIYTVLSGGACFAGSYLLFRDLHSWAGLFARSIFFCVVFAGGATYLKLSPDIQPVLRNIRKRMGLQ
ncbi:MAG: polysaccharide biosynthesis C-terminal domain-containing protein [Sphingobacteriales bacterium]|nr:polysaccharide biosynthesis C-terminal domain-containing protein [Sphingobacteriales bacterium]